MVNIGNSWDELLSEEFQKTYYLELREFLKKEYFTKTVYPDMYDIFNALKMTPYEDVRVVLLGQDPYHQPGQAHGLCFSVQRGVAKPPSLVNIFKELESDLGIPEPSHGCLESWAGQGVLLLNSVLTVRRGEAGSHAKHGWEQLTDRIIELIGKRDVPTVFILWGAYARAKARLISSPAHLILESPHPSPLSASRGFFGGKFFSRSNDFLISSGRGAVDWRIGD